MLSLIRADLVSLEAPDGRNQDTPIGRFNRKHLVLPDYLIVEDQPEEDAARPVFDLLWQSAGYDGSPNYNSRGQRLRR